MKESYVHSILWTELNTYGDTDWPIEKNVIYVKYHVMKIKAKNEGYKYTPHKGREVGKNNTPIIHNEV